jgi:hypothetical protein
MTSQPDKLFRDKLENFQQPAPLGAWDRIESKLSRPAYKLVWVRVAAGVALLTAAAILLWPAEKPEQQLVKTNEQNSIKSNDTLQKQMEEKEEKILTPKKPVAPLQALQTETVRKSKNQLPVEKSEKPVQDSVVIPVVQESTTLLAEVVPSLEKDESKKIVYTADEVNARFLKKKLPPQATPDPKEASGIQRLIGLAYDAKNSEAPLGDLRQKKDDLLALNFGKKKGEN